MEKAIPAGIGLGLVLIFGSIFIGGDWVVFFDVASIALVLGGTVAGLVVSHSFDELKALGAGVKQMLFYEPPDLRALVTKFVDLARIARREGLLALDRQIGEVDDELVRMGLEMAVDGTPGDEIDDLIKIRVSAELNQQGMVPRFFNTAGMFCPAFGMIGTLIGLIQMMQNLTDPSAIGAGMAVAMITTFYGALFANLIFLPLATKAKSQLAEVARSTELVRAGVLSIVRGESPTLVEQRLNLYLDPGAAAMSAEAEEPPLAKAA